MSNKIKNVYNKAERDVMIKKMRKASETFYAAAVEVGNHPFIEFTGLMNEYINACSDANEQGIDFTQCITHSGRQLPMKPYQVEYTNEKLECIFTGRSVMNYLPKETVQKQE